jgi:predicted phage baseplate assembly protein
VVPPTRWQARRQLLDSAGDATDLVVEIDDDGTAQLRFGDDVHGQRPNTGTAFVAAYRVGNGAVGNVGADAIVHLVGPQPALALVLGVRNPLPAIGGVEPESIASVRRNAPEAFRTQQRAVTTDDYAAVTQRDPQVQRAAASLRWTGSWHTVFITADPWDGVDPVPLKNGLAAEVERLRMAGHDLVFDDPRRVSLDLALHVCVKADYFRSQVRQGLLQVLGDQALPDGRRGLFHPDNFTFGQGVYVSTVYAAAHRVPGVASVQVTRFQRQGRDDARPLMDGVLPLGALEIARLANDPDFPERGVLRLDLHGGK